MSVNNDVRSADDAPLTFAESSLLLSALFVLLTTLVIAVHTL